MKKNIVRLSFILCLFLWTCPLVFGANRVENITIEALIQQDGTLSITQWWEGSFTEGTEN